MIVKHPIYPDRVRKITGSFSWLDHRLIGDGFLAAMSPDEMLLYFFLVLVGDRYGLSFYGYDNICRILHFDVERFIRAQHQLIRKSMIACGNGIYQVLQLPKKSIRTPRPSAETERMGESLSMADIFKRLEQAQ